VINAAHMGNNKRIFYSLIPVRLLTNLDLSGPRGALQSHVSFRRLRTCRRMGYRLLSARTGLLHCSKQDRSLDHLVGAQLKGRGYVETQRLRDIQIEG
jgi:hypothetical protein